MVRGKITFIQKRRGTPIATGFHKFEEKGLLGAETRTQINREHTFWRSWWKGTKEHLEGQLTGSLVDFVIYENIEEKPFEQFLQDLRNYSFENAIEDLQNGNGLDWIG
ncbi:MAG: hypothetical protein AB7P69_27380 [Candidatus Binatia bacterium]